MKFIILAFFLATASAKPKIDTRITSGVPGTAGILKCYVNLVLTFDTAGPRTCGGCIIFPGNVVLTAGSCVYNAGDGLIGINSIQFFNTLSGQAGSYASYTVSNIYIATGFDITKPTTSLNDIAAIVLASNVQTSPNYGPVQPIFDATADAYVGKYLVTCGHGFVDNKQTKPTTLQCTTLRVVPVKECLATAAAPPKFICVRNTIDKNVCGGDVGSPVFVNGTNGLQLVGIVSQYAETRTNARCKEGHIVFVTQIGNFQPFVTQPAANSLTDL